MQQAGINQAAGGPRGARSVSPHRGARSVGAKGGARRAARKSALCQRRRGAHHAVPGQGRRCREAVRRPTMSSACGGAPGRSRQAAGARAVCGCGRWCGAGGRQRPRGCRHKDAEAVGNMHKGGVWCDSMFEKEGHGGNFHTADATHSCKAAPVRKWTGGVNQCCVRPMRTRGETAFRKCHSKGRGNDRSHGGVSIRRAAKSAP